MRRGGVKMSEWNVQRGEEASRAKKDGTNVLLFVPGGQ
jgi:hypothetical protein